MKSQADEPDTVTEASAAFEVRGRLFRKYVALFAAVVCGALVTNGLFDIWFSYLEQRALLIRIQHGQADSAAARISQFVNEIEDQLARATQLPWSPDSEEGQIEAVRMLRQVPAITELARLDAAGREQILSSRVARDVVGSQKDFSRDPVFVEAVSKQIYYSPVYFLRESEPYMTLAMAGARGDYGVIVAQVNLKFIWDVVSEIKVGEHGQAYVVDAEARLIAHPDISQVLRNTDVSHLAQVQAARSALPLEQMPVVDDMQSRQVLTAYARVPRLGWLVFAELPVDEAYVQLYASIQRSGALLFASLLLAALGGLYLAHRMVGPIQALRDGAARIGSGDLAQRITIKTGDELEALGNQFNSMAARLQESHATLERKVEERTRQLELANSAKSRFLAVASHDLRQPLHALGLFVAQLRTATTAAERQRLIERIDAAATMMNELFKELLDISRLDAGALTPNLTEFPLARLFERVQTTFAGTANDAGLDFRVVPTDAWVRSDFVLLEQILLNLVSNAVRYVARGGVLTGARKRGRDLRIEIWDTGPGIPDDQRQKIFGEFYRIDDGQHDRRGPGGGLGLGLAIVERLCRLLHHPIELSSDVGRGSRFSVVVPMVVATPEAAERPVTAIGTFNLAAEKLIVVIDDDALALEGMGGLLRTWGCDVVAARSAAEALGDLADAERPPDLVISDFHLSDQHTGIEAIEQLRTAFRAPIPAFLVSGDINPALLREAQQGGYHLLHKPVDPMPLRTMLSRLLRKRNSIGADR